MYLAYQQKESQNSYYILSYGISFLEKHLWLVYEMYLKP